LQHGLSTFTTRVNKFAGHAGKYLTGSAGTQKKPPHTSMNLSPEKINLPPTPFKLEKE
jgi:hypothetical protein